MLINKSKMETKFCYNTESFKLQIASDGKNKIENVEILKCGEIHITNYGLFEMKCLLCEQNFINIRNYGKHILLFHFACSDDRVIDSLIENAINLEMLTNDAKLGNENISDSQNTTKTENKIICDILKDTNLLESEISNLFLVEKLNEDRTEYSDKNKLDLDTNNDNHKLSENKQSENTKEKSLEIEKSSCEKTVNDNLTCKICGKQPARYKMQQHLRTHDNSRYIHKCEICLKLFISEKSLNIHIKNLHVEEKPFVCEINNCGRKFVNENALNIHIKRHCERPYTCDICGKGFLYQSRLNEHVKNHINKLRKETGLETALNLECKSNKNILLNDENCPENSEFSKENNFDPLTRKKFKQKEIIKITKKKLKRIIPSKPIEKIICDICGKETPKVNMKQHLKSHDNSRYSHKCNICEKLFISKKSLEFHIKNLHKQEKPFTCSVNGCDKRFVNANALNSHINRHTKPREHKCETCNKAFIYRYRLEEHIKTYHVNGRIFGCKLCEKRFYDKHTLERHQIVHSDEKPYKCDECPAKFSRDRSLKWHKKCHTGVKEYNCKICGKQYALYNGLYSHMKIHGVKYSIAYEKGQCIDQIDLSSSKS